MAPTSSIRMSIGDSQPVNIYGTSNAYAAPMSQTASISSKGKNINTGYGTASGQSWGGGAQTFSFDNSQGWGTASGSSIQLGGSTSKSNINNNVNPWPVWATPSGSSIQLGGSTSPTTIGFGNASGQSLGGGAQTFYFNNSQGGGTAFQLGSSSQTMGGTSLNPATGENNTDSAKALGQIAASQAKTLMVKYNAEGWKYKMDHKFRMKDGYFDCSSFTHRCWKAAGIDLEEGASYQQAKKLKDSGAVFTDISKVQAGDLIFHSRKNPIGHVNIAISRTEYINAGSAPVKIRSMDVDSHRRQYIGRPGLLKK